MQESLDFRQDLGKRLHLDKEEGYLHSVDWSAGLERWNGVLEWSHWNGLTGMENTGQGFS